MKKAKPKPKPRPRPKKVGYIFLLCLLMGCTSVGTYTDPDGRTWRTTVSGNAETKLKSKANGDLEMSIKRKPIVEIPDLDFDDLNLGDK